jgi:hypothetical protein
VLKRHVYIGYDPAEHDAYKVAVESLRVHYFGAAELDVRPLDVLELQARGIYRRALARRDGRHWDPASGAFMSTLHANGRFYLPRLQRGGWALFCDGDVLFRGNVEDLFAHADERFALLCVQHPPQEGDGVKKGGHVQAAYARKNWSSVMLWNLDHPAHARLTDERLEYAPGRDLHRFSWLEDHEIGALPPEWNYLVGVSTPQLDPKLAHFTLGLPCIPGYEDVEFASEWRTVLSQIGSLAGREGA